MNVVNQKVRPRDLFKRSKRFICLLLVITLLCALSLPVAYASGDAVVSVSTNKSTINANETVTLTFSIENNPGILDLGLVIILKSHKEIKKAYLT